MLFILIVSFNGARVSRRGVHVELADAYPRGRCGFGGGIAVGLRQLAGALGGESQRRRIIGLRRHQTHGRESTQHHRNRAQDQAGSGLTM